MKIESDLRRQDWSVRDGTIKKKRSGGRAKYIYKEKEWNKKWRRAREKWAASSYCDLSALTGISGANMHLPCPLGQFPWKRYFSPLHIYCVFSPKYTVVTEFSACDSNGLHEKVDSYQYLSGGIQHRGILWLPVVEIKHQTPMKQSSSRRSSMGLRLEPQFTQPSCNGAICLSFYGVIAP